MRRLYNLPRSTALFGLAALLAPALQAAPSEEFTPRTAPRVSPLAQASQVVGMTGISVTYGRPAVKGRQVFGELEPWGKVWRTGANDATAISFSHDVTVEGEELAAGTYALFTVPGKDEWTVIFNEDHAQWGAFGYSEEKDVLRVKVRPEKGEHRELFTIDFPEAGADETVMRLAWATTEVPIRIGTSHDEADLIARARQAAATDAGANHLWEWTGYLMQKDVTLPEMPRWVDKIAEVYPGYYTTSLRANVLAKMGRTEDAVKTGEKALAEGKLELGKNQFLTQGQLDAFAKTVEEWRTAGSAGTR